jgi:hypothetical protein
MNTFKRTIEFLTTLYTCINFIIIIAAIVTFIIKRPIKTWRVHRAVRKLLSFKGRECAIITPIYQKVIYTKPYNIFIYEEVCIYNDIVNLLAKTGMPFNANLLSSNDVVEVNKFENQICLGGPGSNSVTYRYFQEKFTQIRFFVEKEILDCHPTGRNFLEVNNQIGFRYGNGEEDVFLVESKYYNDKEREYDIEYAIIIKLTREDFNITENRTVFLLIGYSVISTAAIVRFFCANYSTIFKRFKGRHFFVVYKTHRQTKSVLPNTMMDLTDKLFLKQQHL